MSLKGAFPHCVCMVSWIYLLYLYSWAVYNRNGYIENINYLYKSTNIAAFITSPQSAVFQDDYESLPSGGTVTFSGTNTEATIDLPIKNDDIGENVEQLEVRIAVTGTGNTLGELYKATVTIQDDDITSTGSGGSFSELYSCNLSYDLLY